MESKVLITGGCGHIGSHLIRNSKFHKPTVVDNFLTGRYCSLFNLDNAVQFVEKDFTDFDPTGYDTVIHLAAITDAASSFKNKSELELINVEKTKDFISKCQDSGVKRFIFPSSTSVYGVAADVVDEDNSTYENPQSPYAESKLKIEKYLESNTSTMEYVILRLGTIFGISEGMRFHTAINKFCWEAARGIPLTIWKDNFDQFRPYLGLNDACSAINFFADYKSTNVNSKYNVLTGNYKLSSIVGIIESMVKNVECNMVNTPLLNQYSYNVSDEKVRALGFTPKDDLTIEVTKTLNLLRNLQ